MLYVKQKSPWYMLVNTWGSITYISRSKLVKVFLNCRRKRLSQKNWETIAKQTLQNLFLDYVNFDCYNMTLEVTLNMIAWLLLIIPAQANVSVDFLFPAKIFQTGWREKESDNSVTFWAKLHLILTFRILSTRQVIN